MNPNTGEQMNRWDCAISWLPTLLIENSQQQRHTGAAVESFRNEMVKDSFKTRNALVDAVCLLGSGDAPPSGGNGGGRQVLLDMDAAGLPDTKLLR